MTQGEKRRRRSCNCLDFGPHELIDSHQQQQTAAAMVVEQKQSKGDDEAAAIVIVDDNTSTSIVATRSRPHKAKEGDDSHGRRKQQHNRSIAEARHADDGGADGLFNQ